VGCQAVKSGAAFANGALSNGALSPTALLSFDIARTEGILRDDSDLAQSQEN
jgi:hypothetical protein